MTSLVKKTLSFSKYPRYVCDLYLRWIFPAFLRRKGIDVGAGTVWYGLPILSRFNGSILKIGEGCRLCSRSDATALGVNHAVVLRTLRPQAEIRIGAKVRMSGATVCAMNRVTIGDRCVIGANVTIVDTDFHSLDPSARSSPQDANLSKSAPVEVGNDVFIGAGSYILKGVTIGDATVIGAGSVVTQSTPAHSIVAGNPARPIRKREVAQHGLPQVEFFGEP